MVRDDEKWKLNQIMETQKEYDGRLDKLEEFKYTTVEQLKLVFDRLKKLESTNQWISRSAFYLIFGGAVTAVFSVIVWLITGGDGNAK